MSEHSVKTVSRVDEDIPELEAGCRDAVMFAEFCSFLTDDALAAQAQALADAARALCDATRMRLIDSNPGYALPTQGGSFSAVG
jgi:hypothetical protein